ncbi:NAD-dependent succinate-semialdehyde dehydrogenase [soil metagenome]
MTQVTGGQDARPKTAGKLWLDGTWTDGAGQSEVADPATEQVVGTAAAASAQQTDAAIAAAHRALHGWSATPPRERGAILRRAADLLEKRADALARLLSAETGKLVAEARGEIGLSAEFLRWFAEEGRRANGEIVASPVPGKRALVTTGPVGPVAVLTPWNFPVSIPARKLAPALAAGCTVVARPSGVAPLATTGLFACLDDAGLPPGVANLVTGPVATTSDVILADARIRAVTFTGSTSVGTRIAEAAAQTMARTSLELGGDAPFIVFDDADLEATLERALVAKYRNNGQSCIGMNRLLLHAGVAEEFLEAFVARSAALVPGPPLGSDSTLGPVISAEARDRLVSWAHQAREQGGTVLLEPDPAPLERGFFLTPGVVRQPPASSSIACDEIFGPLLGVWTFESEDEAISLANATDYGLAAYVCSADLGRALRVAERLHAGIVGINDPAPTTPELPFGGVGMSGYGKEGGHHGLREFLEHKFVSVG